MFDKILIANRGEIACRIVRTARRLGIRSVAVYSDADADSKHVARADEAYRIGPAPASDSYLRGDTILEAAARSGAEAVHPGYGFLSENAEFAESCAAAGLVFIGPPPGAVRAMGSKSRARALMLEAGVPVLPGFQGDDQHDTALIDSAGQIGWPVLLKPSAGGGGKGMRVVRAAHELAPALAAARREARAAFGDDRMVVEKYLENPRHIEVQVFADAHGGLVHLFERDCSVQRRHQKVLEEAPAPGIAAALRQRLCATAVDAARAIGYLGAGTVEFLVDAARAGDEHAPCYFLEMNTRLQVEHPVTELITGQDLVEWQFRIAAGEPLPCSQDGLSMNGHAIEARLYAEDPAADFLPATGRIGHLRFPRDDPRVRIDSGVREGDTVSVHYDPMIAKVIAWDSDRCLAVRRLRQALLACEIAGVTTNADLLTSITDHAAYRNGELDTGFIERHRDALLPSTTGPTEETLALAALYVLLNHEARARSAALGSSDRWSPWHSTKGWRLNGAGRYELGFMDDGERVAVPVLYEPTGYRLELASGPLTVRGELGPDGNLAADLGGKRLRTRVIRNGGELTILTGIASHAIGIDDPDVRTAVSDAGAGHLSAPLPGRIVAVQVELGQAVTRGTPLVVLEAMKMEHTITAPTDGMVQTVRFAVGEMVEEGAELIRFAPQVTD